MHNIIDLEFQEATKAYGDEWCRLVDAGDINPSLLPGWIECVARAFKCINEYRVFMLTDVASKNIIGIIPYYVKQRPAYGIKFKSMEFGGNLVSYHQEIISQDCQTVVFKEFLNYTQTTQQWDLLTINNLDVSGESFKAIVAHAQSHGLPQTAYANEKSPYLILAEDWNSLLASKVKKFRYKVNKREKDLQANEDWHIRWFETAADCDQLLQEIFYLEERSWKSDSNMAITGRATEKEYYEYLVPYLAQQKMLFASVFYIGNIPAAYNLCYKFKHKVGQIKTSFNDEHKDLSPGSIVIEDALRNCYAEGITEFDFLGDVMPHKMLWTKDVREHQDVTLYARKFWPYLLGSLRKLKSR